MAVAFAMALLLAPFVRGVTSELNTSLGRVWPFSLNHCISSNTPGCGTAAVAVAANVRSMRATR